MRRFALLLALPLLAGCPTGEDDSFANCAGITPYGVGGTIQATVGDNQCAGPGDIDGQLYSMALSTQSNFALTMTPAGFDGVLALYAGSGDLIWSDADPGVLGFKVYLPAGNYVVVAGKHRSSGGAYTLTSPLATQDACQPHGMVVVGSSVLGTLTNTDCPGGVAGWYNDVYAIRLKANQHVTFTTTTDRTLRTELYSEATGALIDERNVNNNAGGTLTTVLTAPTAGMYRMHVASSAVPANYTFGVQP